MEPCPRCKNKVYVVYDPIERCWNIKCYNCGIILAWYWGVETEEEALDMWNNRYEVRHYGSYLR